MPYTLEQDDLPREILLNAGGTISFWPKVPGSGNVAVTGTPTYVLYDPSGTVLGSGSATATLVGAISRVDVSVTVGISTALLENYRCEITWRASGESSDRFTVILYDVVRYPFTSETQLSLNDLREERPDIGLILDQLAVYLGSSPLTTEQTASVFAIRARAELYGMIRKAASELGTIRPALILDRTKLNMVERKLACKLVYLANATDPDNGEEESDAMYRYFRDAADAAWRAMQPLAYDTNDDGTPETQVNPGAQLIITRRIQGAY